MKLSEAIRAGAKLHPQSFRKIFTFDKAGHITHSCVIGAAYAAVLNLDSYPQGGLTEEFCEEAEQRIEANLDQRMVHPLDQREVTLWYILGSLNDYYGWSREAIADWLESIGY